MQQIVIDLKTVIVLFVVVGEDAAGPSPPLFVRFLVRLCQRKRMVNSKSSIFLQLANKIELTLIKCFKCPLVCSADLQFDDSVESSRHKTIRHHNICQWNLSLGGGLGAYFHKLGKYLWL